MKLKEKYESYLQQIAGRPGLWEVNGETKEHLILSFAGGQRAAAGADHQTVLYARAGEDSTGYAVSQCMEDEPEVLLMQAETNGKALEQAKAAIGNGKMRSCEPMRSLSSAAALAEVAGWADAELSGDEKQITIKETLHSQWVVNQRGLSREYNRKHLELQARVDGRSYVTTALAPEGLDLSDLKADITAMKKIRELPVVALPSGTYRAVLSNYVMDMFWITGWQLFSGRQYLNGGGAFRGCLDQKIASEKVNIRDVSSLPGIGYEAPFDCEGSEGKDVKLVEKGVLCGLMHNLETAAAM